MVVVKVFLIAVISLNIVRCMVVPNRTESNTQKTAQQSSVLVSTLSSTELESDKKEEEEQKNRPVHSDTVAMYALSNLDMSDVSQEQKKLGKFSQRH